MYEKWGCFSDIRLPTSKTWEEILSWFYIFWHFFFFNLYFAFFCEILSNFFLFLFGKPLSIVRLCPLNFAHTSPPTDILYQKPLVLFLKFSLLISPLSLLSLSLSLSLSLTHTRALYFFLFTFVLFLSYTLFFFLFYLPFSFFFLSSFFFLFFFFLRFSFFFFLLSLSKRKRKE